MKRWIIILMALTINLAVVGIALGAVVQVNNVKGKASDGTTGVYLSWNAYPGTVSYKIKRTVDGNWTNSTDFNVGLSVYYDDKSIQNYVNYFYKIQALDGSNNELAISPPIKAFPPNTTAHGNFTTNNDICASCHFTHTGKSSKLTIRTTTMDTCESCHDGTGSKYDVQNGKVKLSATPDWGNSAAGPYGNLGLAGFLPENTPTSTHALNTSVKSAPGNNILNTVVDFQLGCGSCHDPHNMVNYRLLRKKIATTDNPPQINVEAYAITGPTGESINYVSGNVAFCGSCHSDFNQKSQSGHIMATSTEQSGFTLSAGSANKYMHAVNAAITNYPTAGTNVLPLEGTNHNVVCATCHKAHGSTSTNLQRMDAATGNLNICEECHKK